MIAKDELMEAIELNQTEYEELLYRLNSNPPIEQLPVWQEFEATADGRTFWGYVGIKDAGAYVACGAFMQYATHGYHFLRAHHALVWAEAPSEEQELKALEALRTFVVKKDSSQVFIRLGVRYEQPGCHYVLSTVPYDRTAVIDITGTPDDILARMKQRGRRDVRKAMRECTLSFADETQLALKSFDDYYEVMLDTAERDGFTAAPKENYQDMLRILGPEHCRLFAGRDEDRVITWTMSTISGQHAVRYYGASRSTKERSLATDRLIYFECCTLGEMGCTQYDQMGLGSDFSPSLNGLNTFKTKFTKDGVVEVAPDRDFVLKKGFYSALCTAKSLRAFVRGDKR